MKQIESNPPRETKIQSGGQYSTNLGKTRRFDMTIMKVVAASVVFLAVAMVGYASDQPG